MIGRRSFLKTAGAAIGAVSLGSERLFGQDVPRPKAKTSAKAKAKTKTVSPPSEAVARILAPIRDDHQLPGLIGAILTGSTLAAIGCVGIRKVGSTEAFRVDDKVHLGSDTKAMTATLIGVLVEEGKLTWKTTLGDVFPDKADKFAPNVESITLLDLLTHRAGLPHDPEIGWWNLPGQTPSEQRRALLDGPLQSNLHFEPGSRHEYSNFGYALAGLMAEQVTKRSWEDLMVERLFKPLDMPSAGFGPPGRKGKVDQPWGHIKKRGAITPVQGDNAPSLGPAGTVHCSVPDWGKFASLHLLAAEGKPRLLKASTFRTLQSSPRGQYYAAGWGVTEQSGGNILSHNGSNTMWYCSVTLVPGANLGILVATNYGGDGADKACAEATELLLKYQAGNSPRNRRR